MGVVGHGIDLVECGRVAAILTKHRERFLERILTETERQAATRFSDPVAHISGRFAAKEAVLKMLGTGWRGRISWNDIEIVNDALGQPLVTLRGECARIAARKGVTQILLSITHTRNNAAASALGMGP